MRTLLIIVFFACLVLVFFHDVLIGPNLFLNANPFYYDPWQTYASDDDLAQKTYRTDSFTTYLPRRALLSARIESGNFPLWNPYVFAGMPFFADPQTRVLYPIELLLTQVDPLRAMGYDVALHVFIAMVGIFLFLRIIKVTRLGAVIGGTSYAFSSFFYVRYGDPTLIASAAWIPFFFYGFELARKHGRPGTLLLTAFFTMGYLAGFPQVLVFGVGALAIYALWLGLDRADPGRWHALKGNITILGTAGALSTLLVSVQMIPFIEFFRESVGLHYSFEQLRTVYMAPAVLLLRSLYPGFFGNPLEGTDWSDLAREAIHPYHSEFAVYCGAGVLILALVALRVIRQSPRLKALLTLLALSIGLAVCPYSLRVGYALLPVLRVAKISRIAVLGCFALSAMAGIGLTTISRSRHAVRKHVTVVVICGIGLVLLFSVVFELAGESIVADLVEKARSVPKAQWATIHGQTRSGIVRDWALGDQSGWLDYERKQLQWGMVLVILSAALIWISARLAASRRKLGLVVGVLVAGVLIFDIVHTAKTYYVSQSPGSVRETEGLRALRNVLGPGGRWRTRSIRWTLEEMTTLPANTNQIFGVHSIDGTSTMYPKSYAAFKTAQIETEASIDSPLNRRSWLASDLDDLMGVRFLVAGRNDHRYASSAVFRSIATAIQSPSSLGMLEVGGETRLALRQEPGDSLTFNISVVSADTLSFAIGFESDNIPGDSALFHLDIKGEQAEVRFRRGYDLSGDDGDWHPVAIDVSKLRGTSRVITASLTSTCAEAEGSIRAGWSRFESDFGRCPIETTSAGYRVEPRSRGSALSLELTSTSREIPLEIQFDDGSELRRWVTFPPHMKSRWILVDLKKRTRTGLVLRSDSTFSIEHCRQVWRGWIQDLDCHLIYDTDMCIYENTAAVEKGICVDANKVEPREIDGSPLLALRSLTSVDAVKCGTCEIESYEPERVVLRVSADRDCFVLLQDMYYPGWRASVDGEEAEIIETDVGIRAVRAPRGEHIMIMTYRPWSLYAGLLLTCIGLVLVVRYAVTRDVS
jgi:hypothetical protein